MQNWKEKPSDEQVLSANVQMLELYWHIRHAILDQQDAEGW